jgi:hypothetical protein
VGAALVLTGDTGRFSMKYFGTSTPCQRKRNPMQATITAIVFLSMKLFR